MRALLWASCLTTAAFVGAAAIRAEDDEVKAARKDILEIVKDMAAKKDIAARAAKFKQKHEELDMAMHVFKPKAKGGIGSGKDGEGIELTIIRLGKRKLTAAALKQQKADLIRLTHVCEAVAEITSHYVPGRLVKGVGRKEWQAFTADLKKNARALGAAVNEADAGKVQVAATALYNSCLNCHDSLRGIIGRLPRPDLGEDFQAVLHETGGKRAASETAKAAAKKHDLKHLMSHAFDARKNGGLGTGPYGDAISTRINLLSKRQLRGDSLPLQKRDVVLIARVSLAVAELATHYPPPKPTAGMGARQWKGYIDDLKTAARGMEGAAITDDVKGVKAAARRLSNACENCHSDFRDR